ncbi:MAG: hypothetical protein CL927_05340 [Deltaproteobacteria bacterium]|nr:hypothetical protein [Deltaproteobacteria bacterium]
MCRWCSWWAPPAPRSPTPRRCSRCPPSSRCWRPRASCPRPRSRRSTGLGRCSCPTAGAAMTWWRPASSWIRPSPSCRSRASPPPSRAGCRRGWAWPAVPPVRRWRST